MAQGQGTAGSNNRQKIMLVGVILVAAFLAWQVFGMFGGGSSEPTPTQAAPLPPPPQSTTLAAAAKKVELTPREIELMQLQKETEAKYIAALNELQMLKVEKDIAETNKAIAAAKLDTITSQKNTVELLTGPQQPAPNYAQALSNAPVSATPQQSPPSSTNNVATPTAAVTYTVISVSQIHYKWNAVLGYQGNLYNVAIGDVLPPDGSKVVSIGKSGVTLEKGGVKTQVSLVPII